MDLLYHHIPISGALGLIFSIAYFQDEYLTYALFEHMNRELFSRLGSIVQFPHQWIHHGTQQALVPYPTPRTSIPFKIVDRRIRSLLSIPENLATRNCYYKITQTVPTLR